VTTTTYDTRPENDAALRVADAARAEVHGDPQRAVDLLVLAIQSVAPLGASSSDEQVMLQRAGAKLHEAMGLLRDIRAAFGRVGRNRARGSRARDRMAAVSERIDLDDLERKARRAEPGPWSGHGDPSFVVTAEGVHVCDTYTHAGDRDLANVEYIAAAGPDVVIALIARIRDLETATNSLLEILHEVVPQEELIDQDDRYSNARAALEKGAVRRD
jgi:hypothetical protein